MIEVIKTNNPQLVAMKCDGPINEAEFCEAMCVMQDKFKTNDKVDFYLEAGNVPIPEMKILREDIKMAVEFGDKIGKIALVTSQIWMKMYFTMMTSIFEIKARIYSPEETDEAKEWVDL
ncbi:STAS/SEC14 domain-containing protein [Lentisphaerota bacterium ZTH]|nr:STAS/SEC14 domain-containing protein [Lentisphaerota bacterium]WET07101.1 STAS/SEC14 domain-containing protein [Lentisphaerota bacterium ZTH]